MSVLPSADDESPTFPKVTDFKILLTPPEAVLNLDTLELMVEPSGNVVASLAGDMSFEVRSVLKQSLEAIGFRMNAAMDGGLDGELLNHSRSTPVRDPNMHPLGSEHLPTSPNPINWLDIDVAPGARSAIRFRESGVEKLIAAGVGSHNPRNRVVLEMAAARLGIEKPKASHVKKVQGK